MPLHTTKGAVGAFGAVFVKVSRLVAAVALRAVVVLALALVAIAIGVALDFGR